MMGTLTVDGSGRVVLPVAVRRALGLKAGTRLMVAVEGQEVTLTPVREAIRKAQGILAPYRPAEGSLLSEALVAERREEYQRDQDHP